jgi:hypothetical protein
VDHPGVPDFSDGWQLTADAPANPWGLRFSFAGFHYWNVTVPAARFGAVHASGVEVPHVLVAGLAGMLPAVTAPHLYRRRRRDRRLTAQRCPTCGYDLRASPERCAERGTPAKAEMA